MNKNTMSHESARNCSSNEENGGLRRGPWAFEEDLILVQYVSCHGEGRWNSLAKNSGLRRTGKSCRMRWLNYLKPDVKRGNLTPQEQLLIFELHSKWGNRWSKIAKHLPGRTDNEIKNFWRTIVQKQARYLKIDANSDAFHWLIQHVWMPRLFHAIKEGSSSTSQTTHLDPVVSQNMNYPTQFATLHQQVQGSLQDIIQATHSMHQQDQISSLSINSTQSLSSSPTNNIIIDSNDNTFQSPYYLENHNGYKTLPYMLETDDFANQVTDCQIADSDWVMDTGLADALWNMDVLWQ